MAADRTLIHIRERSFADVLDLALVVVRARPRAVGLAAVAGALPFATLNAWLTSDPEFPFAAYLMLLGMEAPWATAPLTLVLGGLMFGERPTARKVVATLFRRFPAMFVYQFVIRAVLIGLVVLIPLIPSRLAFLNEVVLLEGGRFRGVIKRCSTLSGSRGSDLFGQWASTLFFGALFAGCFWLGTGAIENTLTTNELTWDEPGYGDLYGLRFQVGVWIAVTFFGVARFFSYIDQRIRLEGWELRLRLRSVGQAMEEGDRW